MTKGISPDNEDFLDRQVADGKYANREQALDAAVELLRHQTDVDSAVMDGIVREHDDFQVYTNVSKALEERPVALS